MEKWLVRCCACARVLVARCCTQLTASRVHMPTQGHNARGNTGTHTRDERHTACSGVRGGAGVCVECGRSLFFRARGIEA